MNTGIKRELKEVVPVSLIKEIKKAIKPYGAGRALARKANVDYETIRMMVTKRKATRSTIESVTQALKAA